MQKDTFIVLGKYNKAANAEMNRTIKNLSPAEWDKPLGGYFSSVRSLCSHLYICDFNWLKRFSNLRDFDLFKEPFFGRGPYSFDEVLFADVGEYLLQRPELDEKITAFVNSVTDGDLAKNLKYTDSSGTPYERNFDGLLLNLFNHETHHRGMISLYLEMLGKENDYSSIGAVL
jgi:uncharacterized damage-inducible protein DinB